MKSISLLLLTLCLLTVSWSSAFGTGSTVYVSVRTDGLPGTGTETDPFNGSTQPKFDALMQGFPANTQIHLGAGTFMTNGFEGFSVKAGQAIQGAGMGVTVLKLAGHSANSYHKHYHISGYGCTGLQISNITFDGNYQGYNWAAHEAVGGICPFGSNVTIDSVEVINCYGDSTNNIEQFSIVLGGNTPTPATNCVIKNCVTHKYAAGANYTNGPMIADCNGAQILNCNDDGSNHAFGFSNATNCELSGCTTSKATAAAFYIDTGTIDHVSIDHNSLSSSAIPIQFNSQGAATNITISDNELETTNATGGAAINLCGASGSDFTITGNVFEYDGSAWEGLILDNGNRFTDLDIEENSSNVGLSGAGDQDGWIEEVATVKDNHFNEPVASLTPPAGSPGASTQVADDSDTAAPASTPATPASNESNPESSTPASSTSVASNSSSSTSSTTPSAPSSTPSTPASTPATPPASSPSTAANSPAADEGGPQELANQVQKDTTTVAQQETSVAAPVTHPVAPASAPAAQTPAVPSPVRTVAASGASNTVTTQWLKKLFPHGVRNAANFIRSMPTSSEKTQALDSLMSTWTQAAPQEAADWVGSLPADEFRDEAARIVGSENQGTAIEVRPVGYSE